MDTALSDIWYLLYAFKYCLLGLAGIFILTFLILKKTLGKRKINKWGLFVGLLLILISAFHINDVLVPGKSNTHGEHR